MSKKKTKCNLGAKSRQLSFRSVKPRICGARGLRDPPLLVALTTPGSPAQRDWQANGPVRYLNSSLRKQWPDLSGSSGSALSQHPLLSGCAQSCPASPALRAHFEPEFQAWVPRLGYPEQIFQDSVLGPWLWGQEWRSSRVTTFRLPWAAPF